MEKGGGRRHAEARLEERTDRVEGLRIRPLADADRARFKESWRAVQVRFVDGPAGAVSEADRILLMLKEVEGLSLKELEKIYRVNENALKVRLFRARQRVLKAFGAEKSNEPAKAGGE